MTDISKVPRPLRDLSDEELKGIIAPVKDKPYTEWDEKHAAAELELELREHEAPEGQRIETMGEAYASGPETVPVNIRWPADLLARVRAEAKRRGVPYTRLIRDFTEAGLAAQTQPVARLDLTELIERVEREGSVFVEVRRAS